MWQALGRQVFSDALGSGKCQESILLKIKMLIKLSSNCQEFLQIPTKYLLYNRINNCNYICICRARQLSSKCPRCHVSFTILTLRKNKSYKYINCPKSCLRGLRFWPTHPPKPNPTEWPYQTTSGM